MTPVEHGATSSGAQPIPAASAAQDSRASLIPALPVKQLAEPELAVTACRRPRRIRSWVTTTGAALTRLVVKTPAAATGRSATITPRSLRPGSLRNPAATPAKRKPLTTRGSRVRSIRDTPPTAIYTRRVGDGASHTPRRGIYACVNVRADMNCDRDSSDFPHKEERSDYLPWQRLYFLPEPHGHGSLRPTLSASRFAAAGGALGRALVRSARRGSSRPAADAAAVRVCSTSCSRTDLHREDFLDHVLLHHAPSALRTS